MLLNSEILRIRAVKDFIRAPHAFPGGYPKVLITADGGALCDDCAKKEFRQIVAESLQNTNCGFRASGVGINWENPDLTCDHCGAKIPPAYGDENEN